MSIREDIVEEVLQRIAEERGEEVLALDWSILEKVLESEKSEEESSE